MKILSKKHVQRHYLDANRFEVVTTERPLTSDEQGKLQWEMGYITAGYGMGALQKHLNEDGTYLNFWYCSRSCD